MRYKIMDILLQIMTFLSVAILAIIIYAAYEERQHKDIFDESCVEAGGIPLRYTYHYDQKQNKIEYTCLSVNAVIDIE